MVRRSAQKPENPFEQQLGEYNALIASQPVDRDLLVSSISDLENTGTSLLPSGSLETQRFITAMHEVYGKVVNLRVEPPFTTEQVSQFAGKYAVYGTSRELTQPKRRTRRTQPTDTTQIPTDKSKR